MGCSRKTEMGTLVMVVMAILLVGGTRVADGQETQSCAANLVSCAEYLNTTGPPPANCCTPLRETVDTQLACLCNLLNSPTILPSLGINITQALELSQRCGVPGTTDNCKKLSAPAPSPPGVRNGVGKMEWTGMSSLLLFWVSMVLIRDF